MEKPIFTLNEFIEILANCRTLGEIEALSELILAHKSNYSMLSMWAMQSLWECRAIEIRQGHWVD